MKKEEVRIIIPEKANFILKTLEEAGYEAYVVGGCVRDSILGRKPQDWDITTSAMPEEVKALFRRTVDTGLQHGTVTVMQGDEGFEVTTYRIDGLYEDGRHPKEVTFTRRLEDDLLRRDFTINAMAYNDRVGLVDLYEGLIDIDNKTIRCVGNPMDRFSEDALRILRAVRFSAQLGYSIEADTLAAMKSLHHNLDKISAERIRVELVKLLVSDNPDRLMVAYETGITSVVLPEFDVAINTNQNHPHHCYTVGEHMLRSVAFVPPEADIRLAMLLHDIGKPSCMTIDENGITHFHGHPEVSEKMARVILRRLKCDNATIDMVCRLVKYHDYGNGIEPTEKIVRRAMNKIGENAFDKYLLVRKADVLAQSTYQREQKLEHLMIWRKIYEMVISKNQCVSMKQLKFTGQNLIALGVKPGPVLGDILAKLLDEVIDNPDYNNEEWLTLRAKELIADMQSK